MNSDPRVDAYIAAQADFARPILEHLRALVRAAAPDATETMKWSRPHYTYNGQLLCGFSAFKAHAAFGFWRGVEVVGQADQEGMGSFGKLTSLADLPSDAEITALVGKARDLIASGAKTPRVPKVAKAPVELPEDLAAALDAEPAAMRTYEGFSPSARREYVEWVTGAKRAETRARRVAQAVAQMAEGKPHNWKYMEC